jgi:Transposase DNA-binding/Transposase DDE domain
MVDDSIDALADEMAAGGFTDSRLARRLKLLVRKLALQPTASFPKALSSAELEAAYRFFGNPAVTPDRILDAHFAATRARSVAEGGAVLVVHDSTKFGFRADGKREGLGRVMTSGQAFFGHAALAIAADGTRRPLGVAGLMTWTRGDEATESERTRWRELVDTTARHLEDATLIHVMDREGDDYGLLAHLAAGRHRFIIRSMHNRVLVAECPDGAQKLDDAVTQIERVVERYATLSKRVDGSRSPVQKRIHPSRSRRVAKLAIGVARVTLLRPRQRGRTVDLALPDSLSLSVVRVWELDAPPGEPAVEWTLLTTEPTATVEDLVRIVDHYRARWTIEEFFKALKTGCSYEARQLGDYESLINALAVFAPIACRMLALRTEAHRAPDSPATDVVADDEIEVLRALGRRPLPSAPTVRDVLMAIAALGGHIKYSGEPGWLTLARGFAELRTLTRGWRAAKLQQECDQR